MNYAFATFSETGPRAVNEDALGVWLCGDGMVVAAVADGLGGMGGGSHASRLAIQEVGNAAAAGRVSSSDLMKLLQQIHLKIQHEQESSAQLRSMATTLSVVCLTGSSLYGVHCGDTRVMLARRNGIKKLTVDQTEVARLLEEGQITKSEYKHYPRKNVLYSALGGPKSPELQSFDFVIEPGDWIYLTSDGVHQRLTLAEIRDIGMQGESPDDCSELILDALKSKGVVDNFTAVVIRVTA